ncbi:MAG: M20/M25/M40 family metallo-hydrolase [Candidatus Promineifilaceae bacterium]|nr:M20/M25/M40 family metallo-hydrolase [Candidatus Promineifilaceae bacterium]
MTLAQPVYADPAALLQRLIRFDTSNPPGNEGPALLFIAELLGEAGLESTILAKQEDRPNLITRLPGRGEAPPLLLYGHVDVVPAVDQNWTHPPFSGKLIDGQVWGRGAVDMKGGLAMMISALLRVAAEGPEPAGDIVLAVLADEEAAGTMGAQFLVEEHPQHFAGIRHALGEVGGYTFHLAGRRFYPIQVTEKALCWMKATFHGPGGHGSRPFSGGAMAKLGQFLTILDRQALPVHITPPVQKMVQGLTASLPEEIAALLEKLLDPQQADEALREMVDLAPNLALLRALVRNTVSPTVVRGGSKVNVIPSIVTLELDGRLLPGYTEVDMLAELGELVGDLADIEILRHETGTSEADMSWFEPLGDILRELDPGAEPIPFMLAGVTDGRFFRRLGIQTYGFTPLKLPPQFPFGKMAHAADERVPVEALTFGAEAVYQALIRYR